MSVVKTLAQCTRSWAEQTRHRVKAPADLTGMCAIASAHLYRVLKDAGVETSLVANDGHVFLLERDFVLDVTATQFRRHDDSEYPSVLYQKHNLVHTQRTKIWAHNNWTAHYRFGCLEELNAWQHEWPEDQQAMSNWDSEFIRNPYKYR